MATKNEFVIRAYEKRSGHSLTGLTGSYALGLKSFIVRLLLKSATGLNTNIWTSDANEGYITVTVHCIAEDYRCMQHSLVIVTVGFVLHHAYTVKHILKEIGRQH